MTASLAGTGRVPNTRVPWTRALLPLVTLAMILSALPGGSRLATSAFAASRTAWRGHSARRVVLAFLQPRDHASTTTRGPADDDEDAWKGMRDGTLQPPASGAPAHEAAAARAQAEGWATCGPAADACVAAWRRLSAELSPDLALEAVVLGDVDGTRVKQAMAAARVAGVADVELPRTHGPFLPSADRARMDEVDRALGLATLWSLGWPLPPGTRITSPFGERMHPVLGRKIQHKGVDLAAAMGTPLGAPAGARVVHVGTDSAEGLYVVLDHGHGVQSVSCHLSSAEVKRDARVGAGDVYARTGASGRVTGPHLHYGVRVGGRFIDPVAVSRRAAQ